MIEKALPAVVITQRWLLRAGAILLPLVYWPLTYDHYVLPKLLLARSLVLALAVLLVIRWLAAGARVIKRTPLDVPLLRLLAFALLPPLGAAVRRRREQRQRGALRHVHALRRRADPDHICRLVLALRSVPRGLQ